MIAEAYWKEARVPETEFMPERTPCGFHNGLVDEPLFYTPQIQKIEGGRIFQDWCWDRPKAVERHLSQAAAAHLTASFYPDYLADFMAYYRNVYGLPGIVLEIRPHLLSWLASYCTKRYEFKGYGTHSHKFTYTAQEISKLAANQILEFIARYTDPDYWGAPANVADFRAYVVNSLM